MKKFLASLLGVVIFFLLVSSSSIIIAREVLSKKTVDTLFNEVPSILEKENPDGTSLNIVESFVSTIEGVDPRLANYFKEEELINEISIIVSAVPKRLGNPKEEYIIDSTSIKKYIENGINKYEKETGLEIPDTLLEEVFNKLDEELNISKESLGLGEFIKVFEIIYSNEFFFSLIAGIVLCIIIMFILLGNLQNTLAKVKTAFLVNGIGAIITGYGISSIISEVKLNGSYSLGKVATTIRMPFTKIGVISIIIAILLIIIAKVLKHNRSISNSNAALENLGNTTYISNNISNTPYNGYQNH